MWQIRNDLNFKKNKNKNNKIYKTALPSAQRRSSLAWLKKVKLPELFVWWISLVTPLTEGCAQSFDSSGTLPPPYGSQQVLIRFHPSANAARNDSGSCAPMRTLPTAQKNKKTKNKTKKQNKTQQHKNNNHRNQKRRIRGVSAHVSHETQSVRGWNRGITHFDMKSPPISAQSPRCSNSHWLCNWVCRTDLFVQIFICF